MNSLELLLPLLKCPECRNGALIISMNSQEVTCEQCAMPYPIVNGRPVLIRRDNDIFRLDDYRHISPPGRSSGRHSLADFVPSPSVNLAGNRVLNRLRELIARKKDAALLVIGGGLQRRWLDDRLCTGDAIHVIYSDIDVGADVDVFCDAHDLPFAEDAFDAVITTAVLEHVLYPERVAAEIHRVLKMDGLLYSEIPFMQQVHEGAYDFTRYTLSGHRRLFNGFRELESGMVAGPATTLVWAIENFALAFIRESAMRAAAKAAVRILFFWLKYFDHLLKERPEAMDGASCTYFFGSKTHGHIADSSIIAQYVGAKHIQHTL